MTYVPRTKKDLSKITHWLADHPWIPYRVEAGENASMVFVFGE